MRKVFGDEGLDYVVKFLQSSVLLKVLLEDEVLLNLLEGYQLDGRFS